MMSDSYQNEDKSRHVDMFAVNPKETLLVSEICETGGTATPG